MSAARRPQRGAYESFLLQHVSQVTALESSLRSMTYILPGRFKDAELAGEGCHVRVCPVLGTPHAAGWQVALRVGCEVVTMEQAGQVVPDLVIDAVLGIGGRPGIPDDLARLGEQLSAASWLAVDLPSGLDANSGTVTTSLRADVTVTFATRKWCHAAPPAHQDPR